MKTKKKPVIAIAYDFDGTLSPRYMQEYDFIPRLGMKPLDFWREVTKVAKDNQADPILTYMNMMLREADKRDDVTIRKQDFMKDGAKIEFFPGVESWFQRINNYAAKQGAVVEHYVISSGLKEMIEGSRVSKQFKKIYASCFAYDKHGIARWPAMAINYTTKTQFLFRINKGILDVSDNTSVNEFIPESKRSIPFKRIVFLGDGETDIPCMKLVKDLGGYSVGVYRPRVKKSMQASQTLIQTNRVNLIAPADYRPGSLIETKIRHAIDKMVADFHLTEV